MIYDSRDNEIVTGRGGFHTLTARFSPALADWMPYSYQQVNASTRFYATLVPRWLIVSWRVVGDVLLGQPPFYELAAGSTDELARIRDGAPQGRLARASFAAERYYGKVKLFQNLEARSEVAGFHIKGKHYTLSAAAFFDAGRVWTELGRAHPDSRRHRSRPQIRGRRRTALYTRARRSSCVATSPGPPTQPVAGYFAAADL